MDSYLYRGTPWNPAPYYPVWWPSRGRRSRYNPQTRNYWNRRSIDNMGCHMWSQPPAMWSQPPAMWNRRSIDNMGCLPPYMWSPPMYNFNEPPAMWNQQPAMLHQTWPRNNNGTRKTNLFQHWNDDPPLQVDYELTSSFAVDPTVFDDESPGIDFYYPNTGVGISLQKGQQAVINTYVIVKLPKGMVGVIMDKSSVVTRQDLKVEAGLIDTGYRGEIKIVLRNMSDRQKDISPGQPIAQMLLHKAHAVKLNKVDTIEADTNRGTRGFGREQQVQREQLKTSCEIF